MERDIKRDSYNLIFSLYLLCLVLIKKDIEAINKKKALRSYPLDVDQHTIGSQRIETLPVDVGQYTVG